MNKNMEERIRSERNLLKALGITAVLTIGAGSIIGRAASDYNNRGTTFSEEKPRTYTDKDFERESEIMRNSEDNYRKD